MDEVVEHPQPCAPPSPDALVMTVPLAPFGMPGRYEKLIVEPSPAGDYVVACLPFFTYGIQFGDLVRTRPPAHSFDQVLERSGLRTLRFAFTRPEKAGALHPKVHKKLIETGLAHEWCGVGYLAVLLRNKADQDQVLLCLADLTKRERGCWEVDPESFAE